MANGNAKLLIDTSVFISVLIVFIWHPITNQLCESHLWICEEILVDAQFGVQIVIKFSLIMCAYRKTTDALLVAVNHFRRYSVNIHKSGFSSYSAARLSASNQFVVFVRLAVTCYTKNSVFYYVVQTLLVRHSHKKSTPYISLKRLLKMANFWEINPSVTVCCINQRKTLIANCWIDLARSLQLGVLRISSFIPTFRLIVKAKLIKSE